MPKKDEAFPKANAEDVRVGPRTKRQREEDYAKLLGLDIKAGASDAELTAAIKEQLGKQKPLRATRIEAKE